MLHSLRRTQDPNCSLWNGGGVPAVQPNLQPQYLAAGYDFNGWCAYGHPSYTNAYLVPIQGIRANPLPAMDGTSDYNSLQVSLQRRFGQPSVFSAFSSGACADQIAFLKAGGTGILNGDGNLTYSPEKVLEAYYDFDRENRPLHDGLPVRWRPCVQRRPRPRIDFRGETPLGGVMADAGAAMAVRLARDWSSTDCPFHVAGGPDSSAIGVPQAQEGFHAPRRTSCGFAAPIDKLSRLPPAEVNN